MRKADYSRIAESYDRGRSLSEQNMEMWLALVSRYSGAQEGAEVLDLGCGTGRFAIPMAAQLHFWVTGADSSPEMLGRAREKDTTALVSWDQEDAQKLTYPDASFDAVFMSHLLHHTDSPPSVVTECWRVLRSSGVLLVRYGAIEQIRDDVEHTFFPGVMAIDEARTLSVGTVEGLMRVAGFSDVISEEVVQQTCETGAARVELDRVRHTSVLTMISEEAFQEGIRRLTVYVTSNPDDPWLLFDRMTLTVGHKRREGRG